MANLVYSMLKVLTFISKNQNNKNVHVSNPGYLIILILKYGYLNIQHGIHIRILNMHTEDDLTLDSKTSLLYLILEKIILKKMTMK